MGERRVARGRAGTALILVGCALALGCSINPATGKRERNIFSTSEEVMLGNEASEQLEEAAGVYPDETLAEYIAGIGARIVAVSERPDLPWTFKVLDSAIPNAMATPGGHVYVTRGMLALLNSEAQLVGVLAHEVGHVTARHATKQLTRKVLGSVLEVNGVFGVTGALSRHVRERQHYAHSREQEFEADELGVRYMTKLGYEPRALAASLTALDRFAELVVGQGTPPPDADEAVVREKKRDEVPAWKSTHPGSAARVLKLASIIPTAATGTVAASEYLMRLDGIVYGPDAREGYFDGDEFVHPRGGYTVTLPPRWEAAASGDAMVAVPEADDDVAFMVWFVSEKATAAEAREKFFSEVEIPTGTVWTRDLGDSQSVAIGVGAHTRTGTLSGVVGFTEINDVVMVLLAMAPHHQWDTLGPLAFESFSSLRLEANPARLGVQPVRLSVRTLPPGGSAEVAPTPLERPELEAINQGTAGLGDDGTLVKIAVGTWPGHAVKRAAPHSPAPASGESVPTAASPSTVASDTAPTPH